MVADGAPAPFENGSASVEIAEIATVAGIATPQHEYSYPLEMLGEKLCRVLRAVEAATQAPVEIIAQSLLSTINLFSQQRFDIVDLAGNQKPSSLYFLTIAESGERKTTVELKILSPLRKIQSRLMREYSQGTPLTADTGVIPRRPIVFVEEPTLEGLYESLRTGLPGQGIISSEGARFLHGHAWSKDHRMKTVAGLCSLWDYGSFSYCRKGDGTGYLADRRVSIHLQVQPVIAAGIVTDPALEGQGTLSRFLCTFPKSKIGSRKYKKINSEQEAIINEFHSYLTGVAEKFITANMHSSGEEDEIIVLTLAQDADALLIGYCDAVEEKLGKDGLYRTIVTHGNKATEQVLRIAATLQFFDDPDCTELSKEIISRSIAIVEFHLQEARKIQFSGLPTVQDQNKEKLKNWLIHNWKAQYVSLSDIKQFGPNILRGTEKDPLLRDCCDSLIKQGFLMLEKNVLINGIRRTEVLKIKRES